MRKYLTFILGIVVLMNMQIISAELIMNPNPIDINFRAGESAQFGLTLQNTFDFKIIDFEFTELEGFEIPDIELEANETKTVTVTVTKSIAVIETINSEVSFKYNVDLPEGQSDHIVNISSAGFHPSVLIIRRGDTVTWSNNDVITRTATGLGFDLNIEPNQTQSFQFNEVGEFTYFDEVLFFGGTINVLNESEAEKVNNPTFNKILTVNLEVTLDPTSIIVGNNENNYTVEATGSTEGLLEITNNGDEIAQRIHLSAEPNWILFDENDFNLGIGEKNFVTYRIEPLIFETEETDQAYVVNMKIKASNSEETIERLDIFVPFDDKFDDITSDQGFLALYERICRLNPDAVICTGEVTGGGEGGANVIDPTIPINMTAREVLAMLRRIQTIEDSNQRTNNELKKVTNQLQTEFPEVLYLINQSVTKQENNEKSQLSKSRAFWITIIFIMVWIAIIVIALLVRRYYGKVNLADGGYAYRY